MTLRIYSFFGKKTYIYSNNEHIKSSFNNKGRELTAIIENQADVTSLEKTLEKKKFDGLTICIRNITNNLLLKQTLELLQTKQWFSWLNLNFASSLDSGGAQVVADALKSNKFPPKLFIGLSRNKLDDDDAQVIANALITSDNRFSHLIIDFRDNCLGAEGTKAFVEFLESDKCPPKLSLNLGENFLSNIGAQAIAQGIKSPNCPPSLSLDLTGNFRNSFSGREIIAIADAITNNNSLSQLSLDLSHNTGWTEEVAAAIARALKSETCPEKLRLGFDMSCGNSLILADALSNSKCRSLSLYLAGAYLEYCNNRLQEAIDDPTCTSQVTIAGTGKLITNTQNPVKAWPICNSELQEPDSFDDICIKHEQSLIKLLHMFSKNNQPSLAHQLTECLLSRESTTFLGKKDSSLDSDVIIPDPKAHYRLALLISALAKWDKNNSQRLGTSALRGFINDEFDSKGLFDFNGTLTRKDHDGTDKPVHALLSLANFKQLLEEHMKEALATLYPQWLPIDDFLIQEATLRYLQRQQIRAGNVDNAGILDDLCKLIPIIEVLSKGFLADASLPYLFNLISIPFIEKIVRTAFGTNSIAFIEEVIPSIVSNETGPITLPSIEIVSHDLAACLSLLDKTLSSKNILREQVIEALAETGLLDEDNLKELACAYDIPFLLAHLYQIESSEKDNPFLATLLSPSPFQNNEPYCCIWLSQCTNQETDLFLNYLTQCHPETLLDLLTKHIDESFNNTPLFQCINTNKEIVDKSFFHNKINFIYADILFYQTKMQKASDLFKQLLPESQTALETKLHSKNREEELAEVIRLLEQTIVSHAL